MVRGNEIKGADSRRYGDTVRKLTQTRRDHLTQIGAGVAGMTGGLSALAAAPRKAGASHNVGFIDGGSHHATEEGDYPYEWSDGHSKTFDSGAAIKRAWNAGVRTHIVDGDYRGEARIGVEVFAGMSTRWVYPDRHAQACKEVEGQNVEITFDASDADDFVFREDDNWVGAHERSGGTGMNFVSNAVEEFVDYGLDLMDNTIGRAYSVVMDTADFIGGLQNATPKDDGSKEFEWNYVSDSTRVYSGKLDSETSTYFEVHLDPDQRITFDVRATNIGRRYSNVGHTVTFTVGHPDPDGGGGIQ